MVRSTNPRDELVAARRAVEEAARHVRAIRMYASTSRLAGRLEADVRRVMEDLDDLTAEAGSAPAPAPAVAVANRPGFRPAGRGATSDSRPPVPVPDRSAESDFHPECDDEGVGGGWRSTDDATAGRRRRSRS
jgi:hypothetical protein